MSDKVYKKIDLIGTSDLTIEAAVGNAIVASNDTLRNLQWFEVGEIRGNIEGGRIKEWQVAIKLAFTIDDKKMDLIGKETTRQQSEKNSPLTTTSSEIKTPIPVSPREESA